MKHDHTSLYRCLASIPFFSLSLGLGLLPQVALADCVSSGTTITCSGSSDGFDDPVNNPGQWALIGPKTINNSGTLFPAPASISLLGNGFVVNNQSGAVINAAGGNSPAILITRSTGSGVGVTVNNQGLIASSTPWAIQTGTTSGSTSANNITINNSGTISQTTATGSSAAAIYFTSATFNATVNNTAGATISGGTNYGIYNQARNSSVGNNSISNGGTISGLASGVYTTGDLVTLDNTGSIRAGNGVATTYSAAIGNVGGTIGMITNTGTLAGSGPGTGYGIDNNGGSIGLIVNAGTISGQGAVESAGISLRSALSTDIVNTASGTISASGPGTAFSSGAYGINVQGATVPNLTNAGTISGTGAGINVNGAGSIGSLINTGTITGGIRNAGTIASLTNSQSNLAYSGNLPSNYNTIISSPTNYGKLVVTAPSGVTTFGITSGSAIGTGTNTYAAVMTGVTASNIANVTGTFGGGLVSTPWVLKNSAGSTWDLTTNPVINTPKPVVANSAAASSLATQLVVAYGVAAAGSSGSSGSSSASNPTLANGKTLSTAVQALTTAQVNGLTNVHAEGYSSNMTIGLEQMRFLANVVMDRIHKPASDGTSNSVAYEIEEGRYAWVDVMAFNGNVNSYNDLAGFGYNATNVTFGADIIRNPTGGLGVFGGIGYSTMSQSSQVSQSFTNNTGYGGLYGGLYLPADFKLSGAAGYVGGSTSAKRSNPSLGDFTGGNAAANYNNSGAFAALRLGRSMLATEKLTVTPYIGASYSQLWSGKVNESGGGDFNYSINSATSYAAVTYAGVEFIHPIAESNTGNPLSVVGFYRFSYNWSANNDSAHSVTANSPVYGSFTQVGANMGPVGNLFGLGLQGDIMKDVQLRVGLIAALNTNGNNFGAGGELKWRF